MNAIRRGTSILALSFLFLAPIPSASSLLPLPPASPVPALPGLPSLLLGRAEARQVALKEILAGYASDGTNLIVRDTQGKGEILLEVRAPKGDTPTRGTGASSFPPGQSGGGPGNPSGQTLTFDGRTYRILPIRLRGDVWALEASAPGKTPGAGAEEMQDRTGSTQDETGGQDKPDRRNGQGEASPADRRGLLEPLRDGAGRVTAVRFDGRRYTRWTPEDGARDAFRIVPLKSPEELRAEALAARMPAELGRGRRSDLVELKKLIPNLILEIRYATSNNFMGFPLYRAPRAFLQRPAAEALARVQRRLAPRGLGLIVYDAYRPWYVTKMFWDATPENQKDFVADPAKGSRHNRGCAVDLGLVDLKTGKPVPMPSGYDEFTVRAYPSWPGGSSEQRRNRELLRRTMEAEGFRIFHTEWWHYDLKSWKEFPAGNRDFDAIPAK